LADTPIARMTLDDSSPANEPRLESWGEIALYLKRDIRTAQRYEKNFGLPIRRMRIGKQDQVYGYRSELDRWILERQPKFEDEPTDEKPSGDISHNGKQADEINTFAPTRENEADQESPVDPPQPKPRLPVWKWIAALGCVVLLLGVGAFKIIPDRAIRGTDGSSKILLFVRPFTSLGMDGDQQVFVRGLKDETIIQLGKLDPTHLGVFAPTTSDEFGNMPIQKLKQNLGANYVLEGSVRLVSDQLRIDAVLISTKDGNQVWANSYTGSRNDALQLQDEITTDVAGKISGTLPHLNEHAIHPVTPADSEVSEAYRNGRVYWLDRDLHRSLASYEKALSKDPKYSPALAGLATAYLLLGETPNDVMPPDMAIPKARKAANEALAIDPNLTDALCVLANIAQGYDHNLPEAERLYKKAIEADPSNVTAHEWYGYYLVVMNRMSEADGEIKRALEIDPASPLLNTTYAELKYYQRDYDGAILQAQKTLEEYPGFFLARFWLGSAYREKKMYPLALEQFHLARQESNDIPCMVQAEGNVLGLTDDKAGAVKLLSQLQASSKSRYVPALYFAGIYQGLGERDQVFQWLNKAYVERNDRLPYLGVDPLADSLRSDPRFRELMKKVGLPETLSTGTFTSN
jgi:TolB-like protein/tetratricopeptide (TPR) repeat protein